jgi:hypothetical protein
VIAVQMASNYLGLGRPSSILGHASSPPCAPLIFCFHKI